MPSADKTIKQRAKTYKNAFPILLMAIILIILIQTPTTYGLNETLTIDETPKTIFHLGDSDYNEFNPQINNGWVTWTRTTEESNEIYYYNGTHTIRVTNNNYEESYPQISNKRICWIGYPKGKPEIFFFNGSKILQLTNDNQSKTYPQIDQKQVVWITQVPARYSAIYSYDGSQITLIYNATWLEYFHIADGIIVWHESDGSDLEIYLYNGSHIQQITDNEVEDMRPVNHGYRIAWLKGAQPDSQINVFTDGRIIQLPHEKGNYDIFGIDDDSIVYTGYENNLGSVYLYDGEFIQRLTDPTHDSFGPVLDNNQIVWSENPETRAKGEELVYYNGSSLVFTDNSYTDYFQDIHNGQVVWMKYRNNVPFDILFTSFNKSILSVRPISEVTTILSLEQYSGQPRPPKQKPLNFSINWNNKLENETLYSDKVYVLEIFVKGVKGNPIKDAPILLRSIDPNGNWGYHGQSITDVNGTCDIELEFKQVGEWMIRVSHGAVPGYDPTTFKHNVTVTTQQEKKSVTNPTPSECGGNFAQTSESNNVQIIIASIILVILVFSFEKLRHRQS